LANDRRCLRSHTLGELVARYRDTVSIDKKGREIETIVLNAFLRHPICSKRLSELTTADFAGYRDERLQEIKPASLKRQLDPIRNMFEVARDEWGIPTRQNPLAKLRLPPLNNRRERRLRDGEQERIIQAASRCRNPQVLPIILFAIESGMRRGEILGIRPEHIDFESRCLLIPHTKNGHARTIPLTPKALEILKNEKSQGGERKGISNGKCMPSLFQSSDQITKATTGPTPRHRDHGRHLFPITANAFRLAWERLKKRANVDDLHFHDLRHEAISRFFELGLTTPEVALISGHRDMRMLFRYTHPLRSTISEKFDSCKV